MHKEAKGGGRGALITIEKPTNDHSSTEVQISTRDKNKENWRTLQV